MSKKWAEIMCAQFAAEVFKMIGEHHQGLLTDKEFVHGVIREYNDKVGDVEAD